MFWAVRGCSAVVRSYHQPPPSKENYCPGRLQLVVLGNKSTEQLLEAARVRNLSFTLREKSQKKFDFGFVAEEKEDA